MALLLSSRLSTVLECAVACLPKLSHMQSSLHLAAAKRARAFKTSSSSSSNAGSASRPPLPPFTEESARQKVQMAEDGWNSRDPDRVALAYTEDSEWRNRGEFIRGRDAIREFLRRKWAREQGYRLRKYLWAFRDNRIAVCFEYEYHDDSGQWYRAYGNENWEFDEAGLMRKRIACINDAPIQPHERRIAVTDSDSAAAGASSPPINTWLDQQGLAGPTGEFPFGGGSKECY